MNAPLYSYSSPTLKANLGSKPGCHKVVLSKKLNLKRPDLLALAGIESGPITDRRKRRAAKGQTKVVVSSGVAPIGPMQLMLPAVCATSQMSAYERWSKRCDELPMPTKSGWESQALDVA